VKTCKKCGINQPLQDYVKNTKLKDGHLGTCKKCHNAYRRNYYEQNKETILEKDKARRSTDEFRAHRRATRDLEKNKISCRKYYAKNYESKIKPKHAVYYSRPEVIERVKELNRKDYLTKGIERNKRKIAEVTPKYVKELLRQGGTLKGVSIPEALIEVKRLQILIWRKTHEKCNATT
jgi:hypothetical protein